MARLAKWPSADPKKQNKHPLAVAHASNQRKWRMMQKLSRTSFKHNPILHQLPHTFGQPPATTMHNKPSCLPWRDQQAQKGSPNKQI